MSRGVVRWFNSKKGFGFIELEKTGADVFVHCAPGSGEEARTIQEGDWVEFEADAVAHGLRAKNIRKLNLTPAGK